MSMFDKYKFLHGLPLEGQKIIFKRCPMSWFTNVVEDSKRLVIDQEYTVRKTQLNSSSTYVWLEEFPNIFDPNDLNDGRDQPFFCMSSFEWIKPEPKLEDLIGFNVRDLATINNIFGWGVELDGKVWLCGDPMLIIEYGIHNTVVTAKFKE